MQPCHRMDDDIRQRLRWIKLYQRTCDAGLVCRRCGITRPTLRKWLRRYEQFGTDGLKSQSRRPKHSPGRKALAQQEQWILDLPRDRNLGVRRIQNELKHLYECSLSLSTIHRVLTEHQGEPLRRIKRVHKPERYQKATTRRAGTDGHLQDRSRAISVHGRR